MKKMRLSFLLTAVLIFLSGIMMVTAQTINRSFSVKKGGTLNINVQGGDIKVTTWEKSEVYVKVYGLNTGAEKDVEMSQSGSDVTINFSHQHGNTGDLIFDVLIPDQYNTKMNTSGGDISVSGSINGNINGKTSGGDIKLDNTNGDINMTTSGGDISANNVNGNCNLRTSGGDITLGIVSGEVKVSTSGGDIRVKSAKKVLQVNTSGGDIEINDADGDVKATTSGGDINIGNVTGQANIHTSGGDITLSGANGKTSANTSGGDLNLKNIHGSIIGKTSGGDVYTELYPSGNGKSELASSGGKITLAIPSSAKATIEALIKISGRWNRGSEEYKIMSDFKADSYEKDEKEEEIRAKYTLNGGGEKINLMTTNSNIIIKSLNK
jgi:DUF4097 and DUF4098 domain-containing protein YvlB